MISVLILVSISADAASCTANRAILNADALYCISSGDQEDTVERHSEDGVVQVVQVPSGLVVPSKSDRPPLVARRARDGGYRLVGLDGHSVARSAAVPFGSAPGVAFTPNAEVVFIRDRVLIVGDEVASPKGMEALAVRASGSRLLWLASGQAGRALLMISERREGAWVTMPVGAEMGYVPRFRCSSRWCSWIDSFDRVVTWSHDEGAQVHRGAPVEVFPHGFGMVVDSRWIGVANVKDRPGKNEIVMWTATSEHRIPGVLHDATVRDDRLCLLLGGAENEQGTRKFWTECLEPEQMGVRP